MKYLILALLVYTSNVFAFESCVATCSPLNEQMIGTGSDRSEALNFLFKQCQNKTKMANRSSEPYLFNTAVVGPTSFVYVFDVNMACGKPSRP